MIARVEYADEEPNGLAAMIGGLIEGNLTSHPERERLLRPAVVGILADDAGVGITLRINPGRVEVANGVPGRPDVLVRTDSGTVTGLKVRGLTSHPGTVSRLNRLLSVR